MSDEKPHVRHLREMTVLEIETEERRLGITRQPYEIAARRRRRAEMDASAMELRAQREQAANA